MTPKPVEAMKSVTIAFLTPAFTTSTHRLPIVTASSQKLISVPFIDCGAWLYANSKPVAETSTGRPLHRLIPVEVKYRANIEEFLRRYGDELLSKIGEQWPELCIVLVTDNPAPGRSCFQVIDLSMIPPDAPLASLDLHEIRDLDVFGTTVREYEGLVRRIFPLLRLGGAVGDAPGQVAP